MQDQLPDCFSVVKAILYCVGSLSYYDRIMSTYYTTDSGHLLNWNLWHEIYALFIIIIGTAIFLIIAIIFYCKYHTINKRRY